MSFSPFLMWLTTTLKQSSGLFFFLQSNLFFQDFPSKAADQKTVKSLLELMTELAAKASPSLHHSFLKKIQVSSAEKNQLLLTSLSWK